MRRRPLPLGIAIALVLSGALTAGCAGSDPGGGTGSAGSAGTGGGAGGGSTGVGGSGPSDPEAPTFTWLYDNMIRGYCSDRNQPCHNPGSNRGVSFSTRDRAYDSARYYIVPGDYLASDLYYFISAGVMPPINPQVPADLQAKLAAWIDAGAMDN